uniref:hypothetical protein n=1 Tax=Amycolatopsis sp. CA-096443 TaxID=3239919 RepID=UPI003F491733
MNRRSPRKVLARFREDWAASGEALERHRKRTARQVPAPADSPTPEDETAIAAAAAIAGNVANAVAHHVVQP